MTPTGATFHAWKNVVAESWARSRRRVAAALLVSIAFTAGGLAAGGGADPDPSGSASASISAQATLSPSPTVVVVSPTLSKPEVDAAANKKFTKADVAAGWKMSTDVSVAYAYNPSLMAKTPAQVKASDFEGVRTHMTAAAQKDWDAAVKQLPSKDAVSTVNGIALQGFARDGYTMNMAKPVTDYVIDGSVTTSPDGSMKTTQRQRAVIHLVDPNGSKEKVTFSKTVVFFLKQSGGKWKIDGWSTRGATGVTTADL